MLRLCWQASNEWVSFRNKVAKDPNLMVQQARHLYQRFFLGRETDGFTKVLAVADVVNLIPVDTAEAERGFALMNRLKDSSRNLMASKYLNDLMFVRLHGPDNMTEFYPDPAIKLWLSRAKRGRMLQARAPFVRVAAQP